MDVILGEEDGTIWALYLVRASVCPSVRMSVCMSVRLTPIRKIVGITRFTLFRFRS